MSRNRANVTVARKPYTLNERSFLAEQLESLHTGNKNVLY